MDYNSMNGFNPMMAMQNGMGMPGFGMGMPNMMGKQHHQYFRHRNPQVTFMTGMPGMSMDPSMMMGNNFGAMGGMNDMNMMASMMGAGGFGAGMPGMGPMSKKARGRQQQAPARKGKGKGKKPARRQIGAGPSMPPGGIPGLPPGQAMPDLSKLDFSQFKDR